MALMSLDPTGTRSEAAASSSPPPYPLGREWWTMRWNAPLNAFQIAFEGRLTPSNN
jgi:hypothetical protein